MKIGALAAPVLTLLGLLVAQWSNAPGVIPATSVLLGYLAGVIATRYDIGIKETENE